MFRQAMIGAAAIVAALAFAPDGAFARGGGHGGVGFGGGGFARGGGGFGGGGFARGGGFGGARAFAGGPGIRSSFAAMPRANFAGGSFRRAGFNNAVVGGRYMNGRWHGNWNGGWRHHRWFGPAFVVGFGAPYYYDYGYPYDASYYDDDYYGGYNDGYYPASYSGYYNGDGCYRLRRVYTRYGWRTRQVNVCQ